MSTNTRVLETDTIQLTQCHDGFWLYDTTRGMNLSIRAPTEREAFIEALQYYQERLAEVEAEHKELRARVDAFVDQFKEDEE